jgi:putative ABC transport system permease protein
MALGARRTDVLLMILRQGLLPVLLGLIAGLGIAFVFSRTLAGLLYGINSADPVTYLSVSALLFSIAAMAAYVPARRAMRVDPMVALRYE